MHGIMMEHGDLESMLDWLINILYWCPQVDHHTMTQAELADQPAVGPDALGKCHFSWFHFISLYLLDSRVSSISKTDVTTLQGRMFNKSLWGACAILGMTLSRLDLVLGDLFREKCSAT